MQKKKMLSVLLTKINDFDSKTLPVFGQSLCKFGQALAIVFCEFALIHTQILEETLIITF